MSIELYQERMLALARDGDSAEPLADADVTYTLDNPLCGDRVRVDLCLDADGRITALGHDVRGCVLCRAAMAVVSAQAVGRHAGELRSVRTALQDGLRGHRPLPTDGAWSALSVFTPVAVHKSRHDCVLLPFDAVLEALHRQPHPPDTEPEAS